MNHKCLVFACLIVLLSGNTMAQETDPLLELKKQIPAVLSLYDLDFDPVQQDSMAEGLKEIQDLFKSLRAYPVPNELSPALEFNPYPAAFVKGERLDRRWDLKYPKVQRPKKDAAIAFMSILEQGALLRSGQLSSLELTNIYLSRIEQYNDTLKAFIHPSPDLAREQARQADEYFAQGIDLGPLQGIPYGLKDIIAVKGYPTTWGAGPYQEQIIDSDADIYTLFQQQGAVLLGKLSTGALAYGDLWFGGRTKNPWNLQQGSSGSSAGPASAVVAGLVSFAIGSETLGSIISPSTRCGATGLRPSFNQINPRGSMALSWSMDKLGPITRNAEDAWWVLEAVRDLNQPAPQAPVTSPSDLGSLKVAYLSDYFEKAKGSVAQHNQRSLKELKALGIQMDAIQLPDSLPIRALSIILYAEAAAAFSELTLSKRDSLLLWQDKDAWPNTFRYSRLIPAVEYIQANRIRKKLIQEVYESLKDYDVIIAPTWYGSQLLISNLCGLPGMSLPNGLDELGSPTSISFFGNLQSEGKLVALAMAYQKANPYHLQLPEFFKP